MFSTLPTITRTRRSPATCFRSVSQFLKGMVCRHIHSLPSPSLYIHMRATTPAVWALTPRPPRLSCPHNSLHLYHRSTPHFHNLFHRPCLRQCLHLLRSRPCLSRSKRYRNRFVSLRKRTRASHPQMLLHMPGTNAVRASMTPRS